MTMKVEIKTRGPTSISNKIELNSNIEMPKENKWLRDKPLDICAGSSMAKDQEKTKYKNVKGGNYSTKKSKLMHRVRVLLCVT
jgi:hypothetical protein